MELSKALEELKHCNASLYNAVCQEGVPDGRLIRSVGRQTECPATSLLQIVQWLIQQKATHSEEPVEAKSKEPKESVDWTLAMTLLEDLQCQQYSPDLAAQRAEQAVSYIQDTIKTKEEPQWHNLDCMNQEDIAGFVHQIYATALEFELDEMS